MNCEPCQARFAVADNTAEADQFSGRIITDFLSRGLRIADLADMLTKATLGNASTALGLGLRIMDFPGRVKRPIELLN